MHHHQKLENELKHLESVLPHAGNGPFPHSYWHDRVAALPMSDAPAHRSRVQRLKNMLAALEKSVMPAGLPSRHHAGARHPSVRIGGRCC